MSVLIGVTLGMMILLLTIWATETTNKWRWWLAIIATTLVFLAWICFAQAVQAEPMLERVCEARVIAEYSQKLTREQWVEVIDVSEAHGALTREHAMSLRELIAEAYVQREKGNLEFWVYFHCGGLEI